MPVLTETSQGLLADGNQTRCSNTCMSKLHQPCNATQKKCSPQATSPTSPPTTSPKRPLSSTCPLNPRLTADPTQKPFMAQQCRGHSASLGVAGKEQVKLFLPNTESSTRDEQDSLQARCMPEARVDTYPLEMDKK